MSNGGGFTLIETLVAIMILMLAVTGPLVISQKGLSAAGYAKDQLTAYFLAQDAMEYVHNVRDTNVLNSVGDWLSVSAGRDFNLCNNADCNDINTTSDLTGTFSTIFPVAGSKFTRKVKIQKADGSNSGIVTADIEAKVTVTVSWETFTGTRSVELVENLFNQI